MCAQVCSHVQFFATPWTVAHQAPLSMGFSRQEYQSGLPFPASGDPPQPGDQTHVLCLLHWQVDSLLLCHLSPKNPLHYKYHLIGKQLQRQMFCIQHCLPP